MKSQPLKKDQQRQKQKRLQLQMLHQLKSIRIVV